MGATGSHFYCVNTGSAAVVHLEQVTPEAGGKDAIQPHEEGLLAADEGIEVD